MKLNLMKRAPAKKSEVKALRRAGNVPVVLYGAGAGVETAAIDGSEWSAVLRSLPQGRLSTQVFELQYDGKPLRAIVKEIQYHPVSYAVEHIDFQLLSDAQSVTLYVPIEIVGGNDSPGVKLGGKVRQVIRAARVRCKPGKIPAKFTVDARDLNIGQSKKLADVSIPADVRLLGSPNEVVVVVAKQQQA